MLWEKNKLQIYIGMEELIQLSNFNLPSSLVVYLFAWMKLYSHIFS